MWVLMGVGLETMTLLHLAEEQAGRRLFRRWANDPRGEAMPVEVGGCSEGFRKLEAILSPHGRSGQVGQSTWRIYPARATLEVAAQAIRDDPTLTHCGDPDCERCRDAMLGGPVLEGPATRWASSSPAPWDVGWMSRSSALNVPTGDRARCPVRGSQSSRQSGGAGAIARPGVIPAAGGRGAVTRAEVSNAKSCSSATATSTSTTCRRC